MLRRAQDTVNIRWDTKQTVDELVTGSTGAVDHLVLRDVNTGDKRVLPAQGVFIAIGHTPQSDLVKDQLDLDHAGYVLTTGRSAFTGVPGVFAAGDVVDHTYRQAITAAGSGCQAALEVGWYLRDTPIADYSTQEASPS
jgi:thioredoxin reductase (NADPH)